MLEALHLPPVAQALAVILGVAAAVVRLLTASRSFWNVLPNKAQKALPALLVAVGLLPATLEHAKSWLDVVTALVMVVGVYFTASRGDQRPPEGSDGGPRLQRSNTDPKVDDTVRIVPPASIAPKSNRSRLHNDIPDEPAEMRGWRHHDWRLALVCLLLVGCPGATPPKHPDPSCSDEAYAALTVECAGKAARCVAEGGAEQACGTVCDTAATEWQERCQ